MATYQSKQIGNILIHALDDTVIGFTLTSEAASELVDRPVTSVAASLPPTGHRCLVLEDADDADTFLEGGMIVRTDDSKGKTPAGAGFIIGVGARFGQGPFPHPSGFEIPTPEMALGQHIIYLRHTGSVVHIDEARSLRQQWSGNYLVMTDRDIQHVDFVPRQRKDPTAEALAAKRLEEMRAEQRAAKSN